MQGLHVFLVFLCFDAQFATVSGAKIGAAQAASMMPATFAEEASRASDALMKLPIMIQFQDALRAHGLFEPEFKARFMSNGPGGFTHIVTSLMKLTFEAHQNNSMPAAVPSHASHDEEPTLQVLVETGSEMQYLPTSYACAGPGMTYDTAKGSCVCQANFCPSSGLVWAGLAVSASTPACGAIGSETAACGSCVAAANRPCGSCVATSEANHIHSFTFEDASQSTSTIDLSDCKYKAVGQSCTVKCATSGIATDQTTWTIPASAATCIYSATQVADSQFLYTVQVPSSVTNQLCRCPACGTNQYRVNCAQCATCTDQSGCGTGRYYSACQAQKDSCQDCPRGFFQDTSASLECAECPIGYFGASAASDSCTGCSDGTVAVRSKQTACTTCAAGTYSSPDHSVCKTCSAANCPTNFAYHSELCGVGTSGCSCDASFVLSASGACECAANKLYDSAAKTCSACPACGTNQVNTNSACTCTACVPGTFKDAATDTCAVCPNTCGANTLQDASCTCNCVAGYFNDGTGCVACASSNCDAHATYAVGNCGGTNSGCSCNAGYSTNADGSCTCPLSSYFNSADQTCTDCPETRTCSQANFEYDRAQCGGLASGCVCKAGFTLASDGTCTCSGTKYLTGGNCVDCPDSLVCPLNQVYDKGSCKDGVNGCLCVLPFTMVNGVCSCPQTGHYYNAIESTCEVCPNTKTCPSGSVYTKANCNGANSGCTCKSGFVQQPDDSCVCPTIGFYTNTTDCTACPTVPVACSGNLNYVQANCGGTNTGCTCVASFDSSSGACTCPPNMLFATNGVTKTCTACPSACSAGSVHTGGTCTCTACAEGMQAVSDVCNSCPTLCGRNEVQDATCGCSCKPTFYRDPSGSCTSCSSTACNAQSTYTAASCTGSSNGCSCNANFVTNQDGTCSCPASFFLNSIDNTCSTCPTTKLCSANSTYTQSQCGGSNSGCACSAGFTANPTTGACECPVSKLFTASSSGNTCTVCPTAGYRSDGGECKACPRTFNCPTGSTYNVQSCTQSNNGCECNSPLTGSNGVCSCPATNFYNGDGLCTACPNSFNCPEHSAYHKTSCGLTTTGCDCVAPYVGSNGVCVCPSTGFSNVGVCLACSAANCPTHSTYTEASCNSGSRGCTCIPPYTGDTCSCPSTGFTETSGECVECPDTKTDCPQHSTYSKNQCTLTTTGCDCTAPYTKINGVCSCPTTGYTNVGDRCIACGSEACGSHSTYDATRCNLGSNGCICDSPYTGSNGVCECPQTGYHLEAGSCTACPDTKTDCPAHMTYVKTECGLDNIGCVCTSPYRLDNGVCVCPRTGYYTTGAECRACTDTCPEGQVFQPERCGGSDSGCVDRVNLEPAETALAITVLATSAAGLLTSGILAGYDGLKVKNTNKGGLEAGIAVLFIIPLIMGIVAYLKGKDNYDPDQDNYNIAGAVLVCIAWAMAASTRLFSQFVPGLQPPQNRSGSHVGE